MADDFTLKHVRDAFNLIVVEPSYVYEDASVSEVVEKMLLGNKLNTVYVVDKKKRLVGMITLSELLRLTTAKVGMMGSESFSANKVFKYVLSKNAKDIMDTPISTTPDSLLIDALVEMLDNQLTDLAVVDKNNILIGELNGYEILTSAKSLYNKDAKISKDA